MATSFSLMLFLVFLLVFMIVSTNGLQCYQCGQFNDGVGSITPCLNYTETNAHFYLKDCPRRTDKFCVVSLKGFISVELIFKPVFKHTIKSKNISFAFFRRIFLSIFSAYVIRKYCVSSLSILPSGNS